MAAKNLEQYQFTSEQSRVEAARNGRLGGIASGAVRRAQSMIQAVGFARPFDEAECKMLSEAYGLTPEQCSHISSMAISQIREAKAGNASSYTAFLKSAGLWVDKVEATGADGAPLLGNMSRDEALQYLADCDKK